MRKVLSLITAFGCAAFFASPAAAQVVISGGISIGVPMPPPPPVIVWDYYQPPPPPAIVVQQPAPPPAIVIVPPAPPPVFAPPPPTVVVRPAPVYVQPEPTLIQVEVTEEPYVVPAEEEVPFESEFGIGLRGGIGLTGSETQTMGGAGLFLRFHSFPNVAFELSADAFGGNGYEDGTPRTEIPFQLSTLFYFGGPEHSFRFFLLAGIGAAWAQVGDGSVQQYGERTYTRTDEPWYVGGLGGMGIEWRIASFLALEADIRAFIRARVNDFPTDPAFISDPAWNDGKCEDGVCTDLEGGGAGYVSVIFYF